MTIGHQIESVLAEHGEDIGRAVLRHLPEIVEWLKSRRLDKREIEADFVALSRSGKAQYESRRERLVAEVVRERLRNDATVPVIRDAGEASE